VQVECEKRDKAGAERAAQALRRDLDAAASKRAHLEASFDKLDAARERTRAALRSAQASRNGGIAAAAEQPSLGDVDPLSQGPSQAGSLRGELIGRSRSNVTGLDSVMMGAGYRLPAKPAPAGASARSGLSRGKSANVGFDD
jgi:hypothetical protein